MCINPEISMNTFLFGIFTVGLALGNGVLTIPLAGYYMSFIMMQLVEFFAWRNLQDKERIRALSILGFCLVMIQPFLYIYASLKLPLKEKQLLIGAYGVFLLLMVTIVVPLSHIQFHMEKAENGHLAWHWLDVPLWALLIWFAFLGYVVFRDKDYIKLAVWPLVILYIYITYAKSKTWGSLWCWISNAFGFILLYRIFKKSVACV